MITPPSKPSCCLCYSALLFSNNFLPSVAQYPHIHKATSYCSPPNSSDAFVGSGCAPACKCTANHNPNKIRIKYLTEY